MKIQPDEEKYLTYSRYAGDDPQRYDRKLPLVERTWFRVMIALVVCGILAAAGYFAFPYIKASGIFTSLGRGSQATGGTSGESVWESMESEISTEAETEVQTEAETEPPFEPHAVSSTDPDNMIAFTELELNGSLISSADLTPWYEMNFGAGDTYTDVEGIVSFRGDNFRNSPAYGTASIDNHTMESVWYQQTGALSYNGSTWTGSGWTGQPLMQKWPRRMKQNMNMYDWAKEDDDLVEVIYACMDGYIYFLDLRTGQQTRDSLYLGYTFKGSGALDPRGYPLLYVGAGYDSTLGRARVFVINLLDGSTMYTFGDSDSFSLRGALSYFDSSALVDAESDTLIYPGENGIIYLIHLNTVYNEAAGTVSINPDQTLKWRYNGIRTSSYSYWLGMEDSCAVYKGYLYVADNGGHLMCLNLNTMELVWVQDILDDSNSTPVLSEENGHLYLYVSTSFRLGWRSSSIAVVPIWKIDAETGEIIWQKDYDCYSQDGVSGGVQSTIAVGQNGLAGNVYVTVSMVGDAYHGFLACLDTETGEEKWTHSSAYAWSSPVCVYDENGNGEVIYADASGNLYIVDGSTGERLSYLSISDGVVEASPAVYNEYLVIGTRACRIWGIKLS